MTVGKNLQHSYLGGVKPTPPLEGAPCVELQSGIFFPLSLTTMPPPELIRLDDIAHSLSQMNRYCGHATPFFSVGVHSLMTAEILNMAGYGKRLQAIGLLHDASEYVLGDVSRPLKSLLPDYKKIESLVQRAIWKRFNLDPTAEELDIVKMVDDLQLRSEAKQLMPSGGEGWDFGHDPEDVPEHITDAWRCDMRFFSLYASLTMGEVDMQFTELTYHLLDNFEEECDGQP